jgi:anti-sigma B factor antagonist
VGRPDSTEKVTVSEAAHETPNPPLLEITQTRDSRGAVLIRLSGELDLSTIDAMNLALDGAAGAGGVRLDLAEVTFADATGVGCLLDWKRRSQRDGWRLQIDRGLSRQVRRLVELIGADAVLWDG